MPAHAGCGSAIGSRRTRGDLELPGKIGVIRVDPDDAIESRTGRAGYLLDATPCRANTRRISLGMSALPFQKDAHAGLADRPIPHGDGA
jgi:hypothetical protein